MAKIRQLTVDERREYQEPFTVTSKTQMKKSIEEQEYIMQNEKRPFCRRCVWDDYEAAEALHSLKVQTTGVVEPFTLPDPKDPKYWAFNETGKKDRKEELILAGTKQKVVTGEYIHYQCKLKGHTCRMLMEKEYTPEDTKSNDKDTTTTESKDNQPKTGRKESK